MTKEALQERMTTLSRYFTRNKWRNESGVFQYPRGKKRTDAVIEALEITFESSEFELKKELNLRGDDVIGNIFLIAVNSEGVFDNHRSCVCSDTAARKISRSVNVIRSR